MPIIHTATWQSHCASHLFVTQKLYCSTLHEGDLGIGMYVHGNVHLHTCPCVKGWSVLVGTAAYSPATPSSVVQILHHVKILYLSLLYAISF